ncbi:TetR/AcrR family transcriptional regulator [Alicyclobacillus sp. ALC3]|uniref:TetR/AcrR family transcriptional regulator n=1 Tax=Alicyclobacillus sp. ALC3 TaxID=2796143 RepID=UPI002378519E|nr:TetR/AcrR family transcriptional regulator [Alicyclobacillus sp. ALC3]WDL98013.1 TetR/AcrR family transcriptional regulator [Alicyclobacillus sp. ALC3]
MPVDIPSQVKDPELLRARRAQIVDAAVTLFSEKGFHKTTTRELARASGLSIGALYEYVQSKEDVLYLVCQHIHQEVESALRHTLSEHASAAVRLQSAIEGFLSVMDDMQDDVLLIYQESKSLPGPFLHEVLAHEQRITAVFEHLLQEGVKDGSFGLVPTDLPVLAHTIVVSGQMWAFRRWALKEVSFGTFAKAQVEMLMKAACTTSGRGLE